MSQIKSEKKQAMKACIWHFLYLTDNIKQPYLIENRLYIFTNDAELPTLPCDPFLWTLYFAFAGRLFLSCLCSTVVQVYMLSMKTGVCQYLSVCRHYHSVLSHLKQSALGSPFLTVFTPANSMVFSPAKQKNPLNTISSFVLNMN